MKHPTRFIVALFGGDTRSIRALALWVLIFVFAVSPLLPSIAFAQAASAPDSSLGVDPSPAASSTGNSPVFDTPAADTPAAAAPAANAPAQGDPQAGQGNGNPPSEPGQGNKPADPGKPEPGDDVQALSGGQYDYTYNRDPVKSSLKVDIDAATGAFTYSYPITIPPGRNGMQPSLSLNYHSQDLRNDNLVGYGWSLSIPSIERIPRKGVDKLYDNDDYFASSLSGELEKTSTGNYGTKVENGDFLKYQYSNNIWTVTDKKGTIYTFGPDITSRQDSGTKIFKWMIQKIEDSNGNFVRYEYFKDAGQIYPSKIYYTGNDTDQGIFEVEFVLEDRSDKAAMYSTGFSVKTNKRINKIQSKVSGIVKREYSLVYKNGDNGVRSLLETVTEKGWDEAGGAVTLPPTTFAYSQAIKGWNQNTAYVIPEFFVNTLGQDVGARPDEATGDGLIDIPYSDNRNNSAGNTVFQNKGDGTGWTSGSTSFTLPEYFVGVGGGDTGTRPIDVNGDGYTDILRADDGSGANVNKVYLNKKDNTGWAQSLGYNIPEFFVNPGDTGLRLVDVNADGLADLLRGYTDGSFSYKKTYLNDGDGTGWTEAAAFVMPEYILGPGDSGIRFMDVNGDGLMDIVRGLYTGTSDILQVFINQGSGWVQDTVYQLPQTFAPGDRGVRLADINGDGLADVVRSMADSGACTGNNCRKVYINRGDGTGWTHDTAYNTLLSEHFNDSGTQLMDANGDGLVDLVRADNTNNNNIKRVHLHNGVVPDLLTNITSHASATTEVTYQASTQYKDGSALLNPKLPFSIQTAKRIVTSDGRGTQSTTNYSYEGGYYYFNNSYDRKLAGFNKVIETTTLPDNTGKVTTTFYHQGDTVDNTATGEFSDHISKRGKAYRVERYDNSNPLKLYSLTINRWESDDLGNNRRFVKLARSTSLGYDGDTGHKDTSVTYTYDPANGNLLQKKEWGEVDANNDGSYADTGSDSFTTDILYASNQTAYIIGLPQKETVTDQAGLKVSETQYYYDNSSTLGNVVKGNETMRKMWVSGTGPSAIYIDIEKAYLTNGLVNSETDPRGKVTSYIYDTPNLYPTTITQPHSLVTHYLYDYSSGKVTQVTDPNGRDFQTVYDGLDRVKEEKQPDKTTPTTYVTKALYDYLDTPSQGVRKITKTSYLDASLSVLSVTYVDGLDRTIQTRTRAEDVDTYSVKDIVYDPLGHIQKESLPYFLSGIGFTAPAASPNLFTIYEYDALDRVKKATNRIGANDVFTQHAYHQWKETVTDQLGKIKDYTSDAYGNLIKVEEHEGANVHATTYTYNGLNKLTKITDALGNIRNFTYDGMGRRLTAQDLHAPADGSFGTWQYTYDEAGNLDYEVDPKGQTIDFSYDDLNRVTVEDYTGQAGTEKSYVYDTCTEGKGRLCTANVGGSGGSGNLLTNGGFESGAFSPWEFQNNDNRGTPSFPPNQGGFPEGAKSLRVDLSSGGQYYEVQVRQQFSPSVQEYTLKFWAKASSNRTIIVDAQDRNDWTNLNLWKTVNLTNDWVQQEYQFTPPAGHTTGYIQFYLGEFQPTVWIDGVELTTGSGGGGSPTVSTAYTYYATGEVKQETKTIDTNNYVTNYSYDRQGNTTNIKYPDNSEVQYAYNAGALTETVQKKESGGAFTNVVTDFDYNPLGQITYQSAANGTATTNTYDANELYRLKRKLTTGPGGTPSNLLTNGGFESGAFSPWEFQNNDNRGTPSFPPNQGGFPEGAKSLRVDLSSGGQYYEVQVRQQFSPSVQEYTLKFWAKASSNRTIIVDAQDRNDWTNLNLWKTVNLTNDWVQQEYQFTPPAGHTTGYIQFYLGEFQPTVWIDGVELTTGSGGGGGTTNLQDLNYTYDAVGNILQIIDNSQTDTKKTIAYTYDDLHRLLTSSISGAANGDNVGRTYTYSAIGNILSASDQGTYLYENTNYANPHAVTKVGTAVYGYDNNGNLTSDSVWSHQWDYNNKLTQSQKTGSTVTYQYDHSGQRTKYANGTKTIRYANKLYNTDGTTVTKHIYAGNQLIGTVEGSTLQFLHTDHLTGSNVATNSSGTMIQLLDYQPYGAHRIDWKSGTFDEQRKFSNHEFDRDTTLTYANARYYNSLTGRFISQDNFASHSPEKVLQDPQQLNMYAYARNNPLIHVDPTGNNAVPAYTLSLYASNPAVAIGSTILVGGVGYGGAKIVETIGHLINNNPTAAQQSSEQAVKGVLSAGFYGVAVMLGGLIQVQAPDSKGVDKNSVTISPPTDATAKTYQVYTKPNQSTGQVYVGRTSGPNSPEVNVRNRDYSHHMNKEGYGPAQLQYTSQNPDAVRGQEQRQIDYYKSEGNPGNKINGISSTNPNLERYIDAAKKIFGGN